MMRYLQADMLKDCGINHFDEWAADFGKIKTDYDYNLLCATKKQIITNQSEFLMLFESDHVFVIQYALIYDVL